MQVLDPAEKYNMGRGRSEELFHPVSEVLVSQHFPCLRGFAVQILFKALLDVFIDAAKQCSSLDCEVISYYAVSQLGQSKWKAQ